MLMAVTGHCRREINRRVGSSARIISYRPEWIVVIEPTRHFPFFFAVHAIHVLARIAVFNLSMFATVLMTMRHKITSIFLYL